MATNEDDDIEESVKLGMQDGEGDVRGLSAALATMTRLMAMYRGRAAYWQARAEGKDDVIALLKDQIEALESD